MLRGCRVLLCSDQSHFCASKSESSTARIQRIEEWDATSWSHIPIISTDTYYQLLSMEASHRYCTRTQINKHHLDTSQLYEKVVNWTSPLILFYQLQMIWRPISFWLAACAKRRKMWIHLKQMISIIQKEWKNSQYDTLLYDQGSVDKECGQLVMTMVGGRSSIHR